VFSKRHTWPGLKMKFDGFWLVRLSCLTPLSVVFLWLQIRSFPQSHLGPTWGLRSSQTRYLYFFRSFKSSLWCWGYFRIFWTTDEALSLSCCLASGTRTNYCLVDPAFFASSACRWECLLTVECTSCWDCSNWRFWHLEVGFQIETVLLHSCSNSVGLSCKLRGKYSWSNMQKDQGLQMRAFCSWMSYTFFTWNALQLEFCFHVSKFDH